jgi:hypothetical protein
MRTWRDVARYHLVVPWLFLVMPWLVLAASFAVNWQIFARHAVTAARSGDTGGLTAFYIFFLVIGINSIGRSLPFGLALGVSRRSYYTGTALLGVALALAGGLGLTALQAIERATGGWGVGMRFFRVAYILNGPWYLTWLTSFVVLVLLFTYGMWYGIVFWRWGVYGVIGFIGLQAAALIVALLSVAWANAWPDLGRYFGLTAAGLTGVLAGLVLLLLAGGLATIRRATV